MPSWGKHYDPALIASRMERAKSLSNEGKVSFSGFEHSEHVVLLNSMVILDSVVPEVEKRQIINQATFNAGAKGSISAKSLLREIGVLESDYLAKKEKKYRLLTTISVSQRCNIPEVHFDGSHIVVHPRLRASDRSNREQLLSDAQHSLTNDIPGNYAQISVSVKARSPAEAADKALDRLDFVRGVWNLWRNRGHLFRISSGKRSPVNHIVLGPIHTLHNSDGTLATESWWYEPKYQGPIRLYDKADKITSMCSYLKHFRELLQKSSYRADIIDAVLRYVRALDTTDWDGSFLHLWGVLEHLTGTLSESYKVTIRRTSYMYSDREYAHQVLSHLKDYRNKAVHTGSESGDIEALVFQLKSHIERLIEFHLGNKYRFESIADAAEFMDLPNDLYSIDMKIDKLQYAKKFISSS